MEHLNSTSIGSQKGDIDGTLQPPQSRGRNNSTKSKLLRSHAMREEASPPREPTPTPPSPSRLKGPLLTLPSSRGHSPIHPCVVVSPSRPPSSCEASSATICISPTATLTPPPISRCSPRNLSPQSPLANDLYHQHQQDFFEENIVYRDEEVILPRGGNGISRINGRRETNSHHHGSERSNHHGERNSYHEKHLHNDKNLLHHERGLHHHDRTQGIAEEELVYHEEEDEEEHEYINRKNGRLKADCNCGNGVQCCSKCLRNFNNNLSSSVNNNGGYGGCGAPNTLSVTRAGSRGSLRQQGSSQGSFESNYTNSPRLSRDNSAEIYTDTTGVNLVKFIQETLNKNMKDRQLMLKIEQELIALCECNEKTHFKFPAMSSYQRMLVHRVAAYFGMDHNIEPSGKSVVVNKTRNTRIPEERFERYIRDDMGFTEEPRRSILKRDSNSMEDYSFKSPDRQSSYESRRSKSIEEREEEYKRARRRIFNNKEMGEYASSDDMGWHDQSWSSMEGDASSSFRLQPPDHHGRCANRLLKVHSEETRDETLRPHVAKSYSFGGYAGVHSRQDLPHSNGPRLLTKQDSATSSSRLSPSSSGYKTQSQRSGSVTPSPTSISFSGDSLRQDSTTSVATNTSEQTSPSGEQQEVVWVQFNINNAPKGKEVIDPNTGTTARNPDGSIYKFDPDNVPPNVVVLSDSAAVNNEANASSKTSSPPKQGARPKDTTPRRKPKKNGNGTSTSSSVCSPNANNNGYVAAAQELVSTPAYAFPGPPPAQQQTVAPYNYSYPSSDYVVYNQVPYDNRAEPAPSQEISYYVSADQLNSGAMTFATNQPWAQPVYSTMQPRYGPSCVVYGAPPVVNTDGMFHQNSTSYYVAPAAPMNTQPIYPPNIVYGNPVYPPAAYSQPMYPQCGATANHIQPPLSTPVYCQPDQMNMLTQNFGQLMVTPSGTMQRYPSRNSTKASTNHGSASSQSDSASPVTVVPSTYAQVISNMGLRTPTNTPPVFNYSMPPPPIRPMSNNIRASPASNHMPTRSPTPAEIGNGDRGRHLPPPTIMPFQPPVGPYSQPPHPTGRGQNIRLPRQQVYPGDNNTLSRGRNNNRRQSSIAQRSPPFTEM